MTKASPKIAYLTAGAAGMYCGSCMHDNTLAAAMTRQGVDVQLIPTYTPIRTDEENVSIDRVFFGGVNVYLEQKLPMYRFLPSFLRGWLDQPSFIRWATQRASATSPRSLGALTVSMLRGDAGYQAAEVAKICQWLRTSSHPDLVIFSNFLIAGCIPHLRRELNVPVLVTLQGDDVFLEYLPEPYKSQTFGEMRRLVPQVDAFLTHSRYYADFMSRYIGIPRDKFRVVPLGIDTRGFPAPAARDLAEGQRPPRTVGYLARLAPEKGLHLLVEAFINLRQREATRDCRLLIAGWLGESNRPYAEEQFVRLRRAGLADAFDYIGSVDRVGKMAFLQSLDVLSVPTTQCEPKGLFVLEALAAGVPVVQPAHGAFPEMLERLGGGLLVPPHEPRALADALENLLLDDPQRQQLGQLGSQAVHRDFNAEAMSRATLAVLNEFF